MTSAMKDNVYVDVTLIFSFSSEPVGQLIYLMYDVIFFLFSHILFMYTFKNNDKGIFSSYIQFKSNLPFFVSCELTVLSLDPWWVS